jgi:UDP-3-O-[3-hydroxymyristoyl] glucosamine N-acyltransferase
VTQLIHPSAGCENSEVGPTTRVGAFAFIAKTVKLGSNRVISPHVCIERDAVMGGRFVIQTAAQISAGTPMEESVSIEAHATSALPHTFRWGSGDNTLSHMLA